MTTSSLGQMSDTLPQPKGLQMHQDAKAKSNRELLERVLELYDQGLVSERLAEAGRRLWNREKVNRWRKGKLAPDLSHNEVRALRRLLPGRPSKRQHCFDFIDLFAGIGGLRSAFESAGGRCVFTSEWNKHAVRTYKANFHCDAAHHRFNRDIREMTLSSDPSVTIDDAYRHIDSLIPNHDVLLAGFPCQPFSVAGVSKKNSLGRAHGFECSAQGTLFFDVARILAAKRPASFLLENVKNLRGHDKGRTFSLILETLDELGYWVADRVHDASKDPRIVDARNFVPQHRERMVLVGFRKDLGVHEGFSLTKISKHFPRTKPTLGELLDQRVPEKYVLTPKLWTYLYDYSARHKEKGNGFGFGLVNADSVTRTLSARYYKDGSEILVDRGLNPRRPIDHPKNMSNRPRKLTPRECARLMGFDAPGEAKFRIPVSDTQAYKQFGNSVVVPVFVAVAKMMKPYVLTARANLALAERHKEAKKSA